MTITEEVFRRKRPDLKKMEKYGFERSGDQKGYVFTSDFLEGQFRAELTVKNDGEVTGRVIDLDTEEEYLPILSEHSTGGFVGKVRDGYRRILEEIGENCFRPQDFIYDQSNRITDRIRENWHVQPEFPWEKYEGNGTFKTAENGRWFAAILTVAFGKLDVEDDPEHHHHKDEIVEVINLKAEPEHIKKLIQTKGICRAWHMNKKHWISLILDGRLTDDEVMELVRSSYELVSRAKATKPVRSDAWIIPSNPAVYDIDAGFEEDGTIEWHQHNDIRTGDELFIYSAAPNSAIMYRCCVLESDIVYKGMFRESRGYTRAMRIKLVEKYPKDRFTLEFMRRHGSGPIRSARRIPEDLLRAIYDHQAT